MSCQFALIDVQHLRNVAFMFLALEMGRLVKIIPCSIPPLKKTQQNFQSSPLLGRKPYLENPVRPWSWSTFHLHVFSTSILLFSENK